MNEITYIAIIIGMIFVFTGIVTWFWVNLLDTNRERDKLQTEMHYLKDKLKVQWMERQNSQSKLKEDNIK